MIGIFQKKEEKDKPKEGRFADTNAMFVKPEKYDYHVTTQDAENWAPKIAKEI